MHCLIYRTDLKNARFDEAKITHESDIPNYRSSCADKRIKRNKEDLARIPERPLVSFDSLRSDGSIQKYEGSDYGTKPSFGCYAPARWSAKRIGGSFVRLRPNQLEWSANWITSKYR
jgi:hypothetical protein